MEVCAKFQQRSSVSAPWKHGNVNHTILTIIITVIFFSFAHHWASETRGMDEFYVIPGRPGE
eukprot:1318771-Amphidinium_carterae.1